MEHDLRLKCTVGVNGGASTLQGSRGVLYEHFQAAWLPGLQRPLSLHLHSAPPHHLTLKYLHIYSKYILRLCTKQGGIHKTANLQFICSMYDNGFSQNQHSELVQSYNLMTALLLNMYLGSLLGHKWTLTHSLGTKSQASTRNFQFRMAKL